MSDQNTPHRPTPPPRSTTTTESGYRSDARVDNTIPPRNGGFSTGLIVAIVFAVIAILAAVLFNNSGQVGGTSDVGTTAPAANEPAANVPAQDAPAATAPATTPDTTTGTDGAGTNGAATDGAGTNGNAGSPGGTVTPAPAEPTNP